MMYLALNKTIQLIWKWSQYSFLQWRTWYKKCLIVIVDKNENLQISSCQCLIKVDIRGVCFFWCWRQGDNIQRDTLFQTITWTQLSKGRGIFFFQMKTCKLVELFLLHNSCAKFQYVDVHARLSEPYSPVSIASKNGRKDSIFSSLNVLVRVSSCR